jgi:MFS family permease
LTFGILLWLLLFFGGALLPSLTGIMLSTVPENMRGSANSMATLMYNMIGWMPSPFIYGLVSKLSGDETSKEKSRIPYASILYSEFITISMLTAVILRKLRQENL